MGVSAYRLAWLVAIITTSSIWVKNGSGWCSETFQEKELTVLCAEYDDQAQCLRYANCGHLSALLLRGNNTLERLDSTCTVLGLFKEWECSIEECHLRSGDTIALYTDGITESFNATGEEFGEQR